jgi:putative transposase
LDKSYLDEVALTMNTRRHWQWRAVDQDGNVLDILAQSRRDQHAAERYRAASSKASVMPQHG